MSRTYSNENGNKGDNPCHYGKPMPALGCQEHQEHHRYRAYDGKDIVPLGPHHTLCVYMSSNIIHMQNLSVLRGSLIGGSTVKLLHETK